MTDPDAWMNEISTIVGRKNQAKQDAAKEKRDREQQAVEEYQKMRELVQGQPTSGEHTITSRAIDTSGRVQPAADDPVIANKLTYWESNGQITRHVNIS